MEISVDNNEKQIIDANPIEIKEYWGLMTSEVYKQNRLIYCVHIDGQTLFQSYEEYILEHAESIQEVRVQTLTRLESIAETDRSLSEYLSRFLTESVRLANTFFGIPTEDDWNEFSHFIQGLNWTIQAIEFELELFRQEGIIPPDYLLILDDLEPFIRDMEENLEKQEYAAVGDLIQYEIVPIFEKLLYKQNNKE